MPETASVAAYLSVPDDLISFLKAIPDGRYRRGVRYPRKINVMAALTNLFLARGHLLAAA